MRLGILGGGQLGRMLALAAAPLGVTCRVLEPAADAPAAVAADQIHAPYDDADALDTLAASVDVVTTEFENVPAASLERLDGRALVRPGARSLGVAQDRWLEKQLFAELGIPAPATVPVDARGDLAAAAAAVGLPGVLKTRRLGYDGKGQRVVRGPDDLERAWDELGRAPLVLEALVPFERELSLVAARGPDGAFAAYPLVENRHRDGILRLTLAPAPRAEALQARAESLVRRLLDRLDHVGVLALELFELDGSLLANEIAPRVHNSGHWTIEGSATSQFENHVRAVLGLPLGSTAVEGRWAMVNLIGAAPSRAELLAVPGAHLHLYAKAPRPGRKIGHVTVPDGPALREVRRLVDVGD